MHKVKYTLNVKIIILGTNLRFSKYKQKHDFSFINKTKNCELFISLIIQRLEFNAWFFVLLFKMFYQSIVHNKHVRLNFEHNFSLKLIKLKGNILKSINV